MPALATLQTWLTEAYEAYHKLQTAKSLVSISAFGRSFTNSEADRAELRGYIADLEAKIAQAEGGSNKRRVFRAMQTGTGY